MELGHRLRRAGAEGAGGKATRAVLLQISLLTSLEARRNTSRIKTLTKSFEDRVN